MSPTFVFLNNLFILNEGSIFFQLILILLISANIVAVHSNSKLISQITYRRAFSSLSLVLCLEVFFLVGLYLEFLGIFSIEPLLQSSFQFIYSFTALWIIWLWCFPLASMRSDSPKFVFSMALTFIFLIQLIFLYVFKILNIEIIALTNIVWFLTTLVILMVGFGFLIIKRHFNWLFGCIFTFFYLTGLLSAQIIPGITQSQSNTMLFISQIIAFTLFPILSQSFIHTAIAEEKQEINNLPIASKNMAILPDQKIFQSWLNLAIKNQDILIANEFLKCLTLTFHADQALLLASLNQQADLNIVAGYTINKNKLSIPFVLDRPSNDMLEKYLKGDKPSSFTTDDYFPDDLKIFIKLIKVPQPVNILVFPIKLSAQKNNTFCILLFSALIPWNKSHLDYLIKVKDEIVLIFQKIFPGKVTTIQQTENSLIPNDPKKKSMYSKIGPGETNDSKIFRLESELKLALEEYARVQKLLEENLQRSKTGRYQN